MENELNNSMSPRDVLPEWGERFGSIANVEDKTFWKLSSGNKVWEATNSISSFVPLSGDKRLSGDLSVYNANLYKEEQTDKACIRVTGSEFMGGNVYINSYISAVQINFSAPLTAWLDTQLQNYQMGDCYETWSKLEITDSYSSNPIATFNQSYSRTQYYNYWIRKDYYWSGSDGYITLTAWNEGNQSSNGYLVGVGRAIEISYSGGTFNVSYYIAASDYELTSSGSPYVAFYWSGDGTQTSITLTSDSNYINPYYMDSSSNYWYGEEYKVDITVLNGESNTLPYELSNFSYSLVIDPQYTDNDTYSWAYSIGTSTASEKIALSSNSVTPFSISDGHVFTKYKSDEYSTNYYMSEFFGEHKLSDLQISIYDNGSDYSINGINANYDQQYDYGNPNFYNYSTSDTTKNIYTIEKYATEGQLNTLESNVSSDIATIQSSVETISNKAQNAFYGTSTSQSTSLTANVTNWKSTANSLQAGNIYTIKFTGTNVANYLPTYLNINSSGNKSIKKTTGSGAYSSCTAGDIKTNGVYNFVYTGSEYVLLNPSRNETFYATCSTATAAATVTVTDSSKPKQKFLEAGDIYTVYFYNEAISSVAVTSLNINSLGNKQVKKWNNIKQSANLGTTVNLAAGDIMPFDLKTFVYDGTYFKMMPTFDGDDYLPLVGGVISGDLRVLAYNKQEAALSGLRSYTGLAIGSYSYANSTASSAIASRSANLGRPPQAVAVGAMTSAVGNYAIAIGQAAKAIGESAIAIGEYATESISTSTIAIGKGAKAKNDGAIQFGTGTNESISSLQVYDWQLLDSNGNIPYTRLSTAVDPVLGNILEALQTINGTSE